ncbi:MAG: 3',5'-cyclic-nucleotide phosphodiesterase [Polyangiaceae bacterium]
MIELDVLGCHGGETPQHRTCAFVLDGKVAIDAGSLTSGLSLRDQARLEVVLVSHAHLDHVRDLATIADNRAQLGAPPLTIAGTAFTIDLLKKHFFNGKLWPDFTHIPSKRAPAIRYQVMTPEKRYTLGGFDVRAVLVSHTIETCAFVVEGKSGAIVYSGDTGPTERLWKVLEKTPKVKAVLLEVSFPNAEQALATRSGHHTPKTLELELKKYSKFKDVPTLLYHIKPTFQRPVEKECAKVRGSELVILKLGDRFAL